MKPHNHARLAALIIDQANHRTVKEDRAERRRVKAEERIKPLRDDEKTRPSMSPQSTWSTISDNATVDEFVEGYTISKRLR